MYVHSDTLLHFFVTNTLQDELPCLKAYIIAGCCTCLLTSQMLLSLSVFLSAWILCLFLCHANNYILDSLGSRGAVGVG